MQIWLGGGNAKCGWPLAIMAGRKGPRYVIMANQLA